MAAVKVTDLDMTLQEIALMNWPLFVQLIGAAPIRKAKVCLLRRGGNTYGQISKKLDKPRQTIVSIVSRDCRC